MTDWSVINLIRGAMAPKIVDKEERKRAIARAALEVVATHGLGASIAQIADAAGVSKGTVYLYFESKEAVLIAAAQHWVAQVEQSISALSGPRGNASTRLRNLLEGMSTAFLNTPESATLFISMTHVFVRDEELRAFGITHRVSRPVREAVADILRDGVDAGEFRPALRDRADTIAANIVAFVDGLGLHHLASPRQVDFATQLDDYLDLQLCALSVPG